MNPKPEGGAVVLLLCHYLSERLIAEFSRLAEECVGLAETIYALDVTKGIPEVHSPELAGRLFTFTQGDMSQLGYPHKWQGIFHSGNADLMLQLFHRSHPGYRHYWVVEYDVRYSGPWSEFLGHFAGSDADLLCTTLTRHAGSPHWYYWRSLRPPAGEILARANMIRGFMPIYRFSAAALVLLC